MKTKTYQEMEAMQVKAVKFVEDVVGDPQRAREIEEQSVEAYARGKKIQIENPEGRRSMTMEATATKAELTETLDGVESLLDEALDPVLTREQLVEKVQDAYYLIAGEDDEDEEDDQDGDDQDDDEA